MKKMLMCAAAFCCMMLSMVILSACNNDDDKDTANYYIKALVRDKGTLTDALYQEVQTALSKKATVYSDLDMAQYQLEMTCDYTQRTGICNLGGTDYKLPEGYTYTLEFMVTDASGKKIDSQKVEMKPNEQANVIKLHQQVQFIDKGTLNEAEVYLLEQSFEAINAYGNFGWIEVSSIEEGKQQLKESLESLKKTLQKDKNYTLEFYLTNESGAKVYSLYLIVKNGDIIVSEELEATAEWPAEINYGQWMQYLADSRLVADLSLPGAHDACTGEGWVEGYGLNILADATAKCQDLTIQQLLVAGVRVFDLRPEYMWKSDGEYELRCTHGPMTTNLLVVNFFRKLQKYLADNPTEFCLITAQLSATTDMEAWAREFNALVRSDEFKGLFADFKPRLTVGEMRGHVLMLTKDEYSEKPLGGYCYKWYEGGELEKQMANRIKGPDSESPLWVQDYWDDVTREQKDKALTDMLEASVKRDLTADAPAWVINFPSCYIGGALSDNYRLNAESANVLTINWLAEHKGSVGVIYMDFAGVDQSKGTDDKTYETAGKKLVESVVKQNAK